MYVYVIFKSDMSKIISSFYQVELLNNLKYLIICDIDGTILHFPNCNKDCREIIKDLSPRKEDYKKELQQLKNMYINIKEPIHTDYDGFVDMLNKLNKTNSKLIFLTARTLESDILTKKHLRQIGIQPDDFEIHYTGTQISKGEYIKKYIDLSCWENIIFIDDYDSYIKSVTDIYPNIICYKFCIQ